MKEKKSNLKEVKNFSLDNKFYEVEDIDTILNELDVNNFCYANRKKYLNYPISFDIETTSFYEKEGICLNTKDFFKKIKTSKEQKTWTKKAIMYAFVFGINDKCIIGRSWKEFKYIYNKIVNYFYLDENHIALIYVHNLSFEFQFIKDLLPFKSVFALSEREPIKALTEDGVEFRCSYKLSGYSLKKVAENLHYFKIEKMVGDLDYYKLRNSQTKLSDKEYGYILNDGLIVLAYIQEEIMQHDNNIGKIELTKTGKVRSMCRSKCLYNDIKKHSNYDALNQYKKYHKLMEHLTLNEDDYYQLKRAFHGGFTHANHNHVDQTLKNVSSYDFTSAYPSVMVTEQFPMSTFKNVDLKNINDVKKYLNLYACLFEVEFINLESIIDYEHLISSSKCIVLEKEVVDNGRVVKAKRLRLTTNEIDFELITKCYRWGKISFFNFKIAFKGYLPREFVICILSLYANKTTLKGVEGKEIEYLKSKEFINSTFGMSVTDICREEIKFIDGIWSSENPDVSKMIDKYNNDKRRFLFYAWGVRITSLNQRNLFSAIMECKDDYVYSDTDSVKFLNYEKHLSFFDKYNKMMMYKLKKSSEYYNLDLKLYMPSTIENVVKPLGVFDYEGTYSLFKTLGAKRYIYHDGKKLHLTCAGLSKSDGLDYMIKKYKEPIKVIEHFSKGLYIPRGYTGKLTHTYIDSKIEGYLTDYKGITSYYHEKSYVHLEECDYDLDITKEFLDYLLGGMDKVYEY